MSLLRGLRAEALSVILSVLAGLALAGAASAERVALVIGNSSYAANPLINPLNDAEDMAARLQEIGFRLYGDGPLLEQDLRSMQIAIRDFTRTLNPGDLAVFYYAGHGVEYKGTNYLIPVDDEEIEFADDVPDWSYPAPRLLERLAATGATGVIILDACRNNPLPERGGGREMGTGLSPMETPAGASAFIMYAAAPGQTSSDGEGRNGLFTSALLRALERPERRIDDIMYEVSFQVRTATGGRQVPWLEFAFAGEIPPHFQPGNSHDNSNEAPVRAGASLPTGTKPGRGILTGGVPAYGVVDLDGPPPPQGLHLNLLAGGYEDSAQLDGQCSGFVASNPDYQLNWTPEIGPISLRTASDGPTTLMLYGPDQTWICTAGAADGGGPVLDLDQQTPGSYRIWVGTRGETEIAPPATLIIETLSVAAAVAGGAGAEVNNAPENRGLRSGEALGWNVISEAGPGAR